MVLKVFCKIEWSCCFFIFICMFKFNWVVFCLIFSIEYCFCNYFVLEWFVVSMILWEYIIFWFVVIIKECVFFFIFVIFILNWILILWDSMLYIFWKICVEREVFKCFIFVVNICNLYDWVFFVRWVFIVEYFVIFLFLNK